MPLSDSIRRRLVGRCEFVRDTIAPPQGRSIFGKRSAVIFRNGQEEMSQLRFRSPLRIALRAGVAIALCAFWVSFRWARAAFMLVASISRWRTEKSSRLRAGC